VVIVVIGGIDVVIVVVVVVIVVVVVEREMESEGIDNREGIDRERIRILKSNWEIEIEIVEVLIWIIEIVDGIIIINKIIIDGDGWIGNGYKGI